MGSFLRLDETRLVQLDEAELVEYAIAARAVGAVGDAVLALRIFAFGLEAQVRAFVRRRLDSHGGAVIDEIAGRALEDAVRSIERLRGSTAAEARAFVFRIARLRIVDYHRNGRLGETSLEGLEEADGNALGAAAEDEGGLVETIALIDEVLAALRDDHRMAAELFVLQGYTARETAEEVSRRVGGRDHDSMSEQNVHQIGSRFRKELRARLEMAEEGVTVDGRS